MSLPWWRGAIAVPRKLVAATVAAVVFLGALSTAAFGYDRSTRNLLLPQTRIGGVDVGGLQWEDALDRLRERIEDPLHLPIRVTAPNVARMTTPWDLGLRVDVERAARNAMRSGRDGNLVRRLWRRLRGESQSYELRPALDPKRLRGFLGEAAQRVRVPAEDAQMDVRDGWVHVQPGRTGRELDLDSAERELTKAMKTGAEDLPLRVREVQPKVPASAFAKVVLVRAGENRLYLYENGVITRSYPVATGAVQFPTPVGTYRIVSKRVNPKWVNPGSDWAKRLPNSIPPGPDNPLGSRAMDLNVSGIRIHGTPDSGSIGYSVSHGCVRMNMADAEDLFGRVSSGTPVVIAAAGPARPRPARTPAPSPLAPGAPQPAPGAPQPAAAPA